MNNINKAVYENIKTEICKISRMSPEEISGDDNLVLLGADSITLTEINNYIFDEFNIDIPMNLYFSDLITMNRIARYVTDHMDHEEENNIKIKEIKDLPTGKDIVENQIKEELFINTDIEEVEHIERFFDLDKIDENKSKLLEKESDILKLFNNQIEVINNQINYLSNNAYALIKKNVSGTLKLNEKHSNEEIENGINFEVSELNREKVNLADSNQTITVEVKTNNELEISSPLMNEYINKTISSKKYTEKYRYNYADCRSIAGFKPNIKEMIYQLIYESAKGAHVTDIDGNTYIDLAMDFGVSLFGHAPDFINEAIQKELDRGYPLSLVSSLTGEVAELICELTGCDRMCFCNSGTEAIMLALRLSRAVTNRKKIVIFSESYHGTFDGVLGFPSKNQSLNSRPIGLGILQSFVDDLIILPYNQEVSLSFIKENSDVIASVLVEAVQSRRPDMKPKMFLQELRKITKEENIILIFDEIITGFRLRCGGAQEYFGIKSDLATYGKIVGGGMPIGVVAGNENILNRIDGGMWNYGDDSVPPDEDKRIFTAGTFSHHPITMAAAKAVLLKIKKEKDTIYKEIEEKTNYLVKEIKEYFLKNEIPIDIVHTGSLFRFILKGNMGLFYYNLLKNGIYIWEGRNCFLSLAHTYEDINRIIEAVKKTCIELKFSNSNIKKSNEKLAVLNNRHLEMLVANEVSEHKSMVHEHIMVKVKGELNHEYIEEACIAVMKRHDSLRYTLSKELNEFILNEIYDAPVDIQFYDKEFDKTVQNLIKKEFDLVNGPLFRIVLFKNAEFEDNSTIMLVSASHIIMDGWSLSVFYQELIEHYNSLVLQKKSDLLDVMQYSDYQKFLEDKIESADRNDIIRIMNKHYLNKNQKISLPYDYENYSNDKKGERVRIIKDEVFLKDIRKIASNYKCSPFIIYMTAYQIMLREVAQQNSFVIGVPLAGQKKFISNSIIGNCVNVRPLYSEIEYDDSLLDLITYNKNAIFDLEELYDLDPNGFFEGYSGNTELNIIFNMERIPRINTFINTEIEVVPMPFINIMYDLFFNISEIDNKVIIDIDYNSVKFKEQVITRWIELYFDIITGLAGEVVYTVGDFILYNKGDERFARNLSESLDTSYLKKFMNIDASYYNIDNNQIYCSICDEMKRPVITGSFGYLCIGPSKLECYNTGWIARIRQDGMLDFFSPVEKLINRDGQKIGLWTIKNLILRNTDIKNVEVVYDDRLDNIIAFIEFALDEIKCSDVLSWCNSNIDPLFRPDRFYIAHDYSTSIDESYRILPELDQLTLTEQKIFEIVSLLTDNRNITKEDDLYRMGLSSLNLVKILTEIQSTYDGLRIPLSMLNKDLSIKNMALIVENLTSMNEHCIPKLMSREKKIINKASYVQSRMYFLNQIHPNGVEYNLPSVIKLSGVVDIDKLLNAFQFVMERHEVLTSNFMIKDNNIFYSLQENHKMEYELVEKSLNDHILDDVELEMKKFIQPFDLNNGNLYRLKLIKYNTNLFYVFLDFHHIVFDGMSSIVFAKDLMDYYNNLFIEPLKFTYSDYVTWQEELVKTKYFESQIDFWKKTGEFLGSSNRLLQDFYEPEIRTMKADFVQLKYDNNMSELIKEYCKNHKCTPFSFFLGAINIALYKNTGHKDITLGTVVEGRNVPELFSLIGMFVNTLPIRNVIDSNQTVSGYINAVQNNNSKIFENGDVPYETIVKLSQIEHSNYRNPLFDIAIVYKDTELLDSEQHNDLKLEFVNVLPDMARFEMEIIIDNTKDGFNIKVCYANELYKKTTIERVLGLMDNIIDIMLNAPEIKLGEMQILSEEEKHLVLEEFNRTEVSYPSSKTIVDLFEEQVIKKPDQVALIEGNLELTYLELNQRSNWLAAQLIEFGVKENSLVAIMTERSIEMIVGIIAIWKASGAYVPVDLKLPVERIEYILNDSNPIVVLIDKNKPENLEILDKYKFMNIKEAIGHRIIENSVRKIIGEDLSYIIYTSGTTGKPKGVMSTHKGLYNRILWMNDCYSLCENDVILQKTTYTFDVSVWEIIWWGIAGAKVALLKPGGEKDPDAIIEEINKSRVSVIHFVPSMFNTFLSYLQDHEDEIEKIISLKRIFTSGEPLKPESVRMFNNLVYQRNKSIRLLNLYGPTEASIDVTYYECNEDYEKVPIGKPIANTQIYILNDKSLCGIGMPGELCIGGEGVALGYLNLPELTKEKFTANFISGGILYRTGDMAKWLADGNIEYLGRIDDQLKIRGFRIEPGEIETCLKKQSEVEDAVVIAKENESGEKSLYAYLVLKNKVELKAIRNELAKELPDYMIPAYMTEIKCIPVTPNGKLDRKRLPEIEIKSEEVYVEPKTEEEKILARIFSEILGVPQIGLKDDYFELGGDSIKAIRMKSKLFEEGYEVSIQDILKYHSIEELAGKLTRGEKLRIYSQEEVVGEVPLTPIQKLFYSWDLKSKDYFNQTIMLKFNERLDVDVVEKVMEKIMERHDILRATFINGVQNILSIDKYSKIKIHMFDFINYHDEIQLENEIEKQNINLQSSMNLENSPLVKAAIYKAPDSDHFMICIHHLVVDGISMRIILEDFMRGYHQLKTSAEITLAPKTVSYKDWSEGIIEYSQSEKLKSELNYWRNLIKSINQMGLIGRKSNDTYQNSSTLFTVDETTTKEIVYNIGKFYNTDIFDILLTGLGISLKQLLKIDFIPIQIEGHGREEMHKPIAIDQTVGWFTSIFPVQLSVSDSIEKNIINTKEMLRKIPNNGFGYNILKLNEEGLKIDNADICFNFLGFFDLYNTGMEFEISKYSTGNNTAEVNPLLCNIVIDAWILQNRLYFDVKYNSVEYSIEQMKDFEEYYIMALKEIVNHCNNLSESVDTMSDITSLDLTEETLNEIMDLF